MGGLIAEFSSLIIYLLNIIINIYVPNRVPTILFERR